MNSFVPHPLLANPHAQSIGGYLLKRRRGVQFTRERIETPDGDFVDVDFADVPGHAWNEFAEDAPVGLLLHGLEGCSTSSYMFELYRQLVNRGIRPVGMNYCFCSGEVNRTNRLYHAGATEDVALVLDVLHQRFPDVALVAVGVSLGANLLLKLLGEQGNTTHLSRAAVISPPFDLAQGIPTFDNGSGRFYAQRLLKTLREKVMQKEVQLRGVVDVERVLKVNTVFEFDDLFTARLHGFRDAVDYYARSSSGQFLPDIRIPMLIIRSEDDPFFPPTEIPHDVIAANPYLTALITKCGGHVGFIGKGLTFWAEGTAAQWVAQV